MCEVMGIVNLTPDSFSDGGKFNRPEEALRRAENLIAEGAAIIDLGGESTRPGATPISWQEEWRRLEPVLTELARRNHAGVRLSVDTYHLETAARSLAAGATIINCVRGESAAAMLELLRGTSAAELILPDSTAAQVAAAGLSPRVYLDPMLGFGTTREEDLAKLQALPESCRRARIVVGASRKRIVKKLVGDKAGGKDLAGNLAIVAWAARAGAAE